MRSRAGYWLAGLIVVLGLAAGAVVAVGAVGRLEERVDGFVRVEVGDTRVVSLPEGDLSVFFETRDPEVLPAAADVRLALRAPDGRRLRPRGVTFDLTYSLGSRHAERIAKVRVPSAGRYELASDGAFGHLVIGEVPGLADAGRILLATMLGMLGLLLGALLAIITAVRRNR